MLDQPAKYIGMIGSKRRIKACFERFKEEEQVSEELISRVYAPIGLDIATETPEEIALGILGEIIKVRRGGKAQSLSQKRVSGSRDNLVKGVVFSDLGRPESSWVSTGCGRPSGSGSASIPIPARSTCGRAGRTWTGGEQVRQHGGKIILPSPDPAFCNAFLFTGFVEGWESATGSRERAAVVVPEVREYPVDKLEIIAAVSLKQAHSVRDGDELTVVFDG